MNTPIYEEIRHGLIIKIYIDENAANPRTEEDNMGTMICFHRRLKLGDTHKLTVKEAKNLVKRKDVISLPLYLYDHGGLSISTGSFIGRAHHAEWDSGEIGFIYITKETIRKEYGSAGQKNIDRAIEYLKNEVKIYNDYLAGNVYGYVIENKDGEHIDSCWGYFGDYDDKKYSALKAATATVEFITHNGTTTATGQELMPLTIVEKKNE